MKLYVVHQTIAGYAREDRDCSSVIGTYTDSALADKIARAWSAQVKEVVLDEIPPGILDFLRHIGSL